MTYFRNALLVCPVACLLGQTPPPKPTQPPPVQEVTRQVDVSKLIAGGPTVPPDRVIITVGDVKITAAQYDTLVESLPQQQRTMARGAGRKQFADVLVQVLVLDQEGKRLKLNETPAFHTLSMFQNANVLASMVVNQSKVTDADLLQYYNDHKSEFEQVRARHILIRFSGSQVPAKPGQKDLSDAEALAKAQDLRKKIQDGGDFAEFAKQESDDVGSGAKGGDLGSFGHGQMVPSFEAVAFAIKVGEISEPVKSQFGYHIIKVEAHDYKSFDDLRAELETRAKPDQTKKTIDDLEKKTPPVFDPEFFGMDKK
jgi:parvulin-like peptidyl-prolyl isomerase